MINLQKPTCENGKLRTFHTAGLRLNKDVSVGCRMVNNAFFPNKIVLSPAISAIFAYYTIFQNNAILSSFIVRAMQ